MTVIDRVNRWGASGKRVLVGPGELSGPASDAIKGRFASITRITGAVDFYEITDGSGANEGTYTISVKPYTKDGFRASLGGVGRVALVRQADGVNTPTATATLLSLKRPRDKQTAVTLGPASIATTDRLFLIIERQDVSTIKYQVELTRVLDAITISTQPSASSVTAPASASFTVGATTNDGGTLSYQWQLSTNGGTSYSNITNGGVYSGATTTTLSISDSTGLNGNLYRARVTSTGGSVAVNSDGALLTVG
jgi:hypothetical protein